MDQYNGIPISKVGRIGLPEVSWRPLRTAPRVPFADPVVEALYQASFDEDGALNEPLNVYDDAEQIVAIVRAAIAQYTEDLSA